MKFFDISLYLGLTGNRFRHDFLSFAEKEFGLSLDDTPENRVHIFNLFQEKWWKIESFIWDLEANLLPVLAEMEYAGINFDDQKMTEIGVRIRKERDEVEAKIYSLSPSTFNIASPKQIQEIFQEMGIELTKKNKTGYSVDVDVLEELSKEHEIAKHILRHRTLSKLDSTYVLALLKSINPNTKRIHTTYDSLGASTGRMSSNDPNLQNIPTGDGYAEEIKSCFIPTEGNIFLVADYSQIELRVLAFLSEDENLLDAFKKGEDIHTRTAKFLFWDKEVISGHERRVAKSVNFGVIYGITGFWLSKTLDCSPWEANAYIDAFYKKYPKVRSYYDNLLEEGRKNGYVETFFGRRRNIPGLADANKTIRGISEREAMNMPIQWTAADILKLAMIDIAQEIKAKNLKGKMLLQVHDELVFDIPVAEKEAFLELVRDNMENVLSKETFHAIKKNDIPPLVVDIHTGKNWTEAKG